MTAPDHDQRKVLATNRFTVVEHRYRPRPDAPLLTKHVVQHPGAVVIVPALEGDRVCLIRNHRIAVGETLIELPAGTLEPPEPPAVAAERELQEETGYRAERFRPLGAFFMSPGILNERMHLFLAEGLTPGDAAREPGEEIENLVVTRDQALAMAADGRIADAKSIAALFLWDRARSERAL